MNRLAIFPFITLVACTDAVTSLEPTTETTPAVGPVVTQSGGAPNYQLTYQEGSNTILVQLNAATVATLAADGSLGRHADFDGYRSRDYYGFRAVSDSGESSVIVLFDDTVTGGLGTASISRLVETQMPTSGAVTYLGTYQGVVEQRGFEVTGQVELNASFDAGLVSGQITNRSELGIGGGPFTESVPDITLPQGTLLDDGSFSGTITGADYVVAAGTFGGTYVGSGNYQGLITGATGEEAVGTLTITYERTGAEATQTEVGVFILDAE